MTRLLFVHGTGVREDAFDETFDLVKKRFAAIRSYKMEPCFWGENLGALLNESGASIPSLKAAGGQADDAQVPSDSVDEGNLELWAALEIDPLNELRGLMLSQRSTPRDARSPTDLIRTFCSRLSDVLATENPFTIALLNSPLHRTGPQAAEKLMADAVFQRAVARPDIDAALKSWAIARAYIALSMTEWDAQNRSMCGLSGKHRDRLVNLLATQLGGDGRAFGSRVGEAAFKLVWPMVAPSLERRRDTWSRAGVPIVGDVLKYFARGARMRSFLKERILESDEETIILAHSLGAIVALDVLTSHSFNNVTHFVTVGTQIGFLYEIDALPSIPYGLDIKGQFPEWHNVVDKRDFLAYLTEPFFGGVSKDHFVDSAVPFPRSHSAYFDNDELYRVLDMVLP